MKKEIIITNANEHNLKNVSLSIPRNKLIVVTGISGSGKSSLAFDTIFREGQRRYVESLSPYIRQFLGGIWKPNVESIEGLSPAISIDQKSVSHSPRSIVATMTEIYDYLRLIWSRIGVPICPKHKIPITAKTKKTIIDEILNKYDGELVRIVSPVITDTKGTFQELFNTWRSEGFSKIIVNDKVYSLDEIKRLSKGKKYNISLYIDLIHVDTNIHDLRSRIFSAVEQALEYGHGYVLVQAIDKKSKQITKSDTYSQKLKCSKCDFLVPELLPKLFSFNSPYGMCPQCKGLGMSMDVNLDFLIPDWNKSINRGGIKAFQNTIHTGHIDWLLFEQLLQHYDVDLDTPLNELSEEIINILLFGSTEAISYQITSSTGNIYKRKGPLEGIAAKIKRRYFETKSAKSREGWGRYMSEYNCTLCKGQRLCETALSVKVHGLSIIDFIRMSVKEINNWLNNIKITKKEYDIVHMALNELKSRIHFLDQVGLNYLTLDRRASTLSGGESQRIRLATQTSSLLTGVVYVLDEPSIGLHQKDNIKLINALKKMRDNDNTIIVVEHDEETIRSADWIVDIGPGAGIYGGQIVANGTYEQVISNKNSIIGPYLTGEKKIDVPSTRGGGNSKKLKIIGAKKNNLKNLNVVFPLGKLICVTGVSGSGKSTLVSDILYSALKTAMKVKLNKKRLSLSSSKYLSHHFKNRIKVIPDIEHYYKKIEGFENVERVVNITQAPIGRTSRSTPATYTKVFDHIRDIFANRKEAILRGYTKSRFSFNRPEGRCQRCWGKGTIITQMFFLPDVERICDECNGARYNEETLQVKYRGKSIADVLDLTVIEAIDFFKGHPAILNTLGIMRDVGLSYLSLGASATILSGGEAQRLKLSLHLKENPSEHTIYILDEPTTGLHIADVAKLLKVLKRLVSNSNTVIVIEHNLHFIKVADHIIDLGPNGGDDGGEIIATGTPEQVAKIKESYTGQYLKGFLEGK